MPNIQAVCLGHKEKFSGNYQTIVELREEIIAKYRKYLINKNVKETRINFILTYINESTGNEELLDDINVIKKHGDQLFQLSVKRIWEACCTCLSPFGITPGQIPCECENLDCGYQYCNNCVQTMKRLKHENKQIYCMYCGNSSLNGPKQNQLLLNLLWKQYSIKYGIELLLTTNIMPGTLSNDIECRIIHIKSLIQTLKNKINIITFKSEMIEQEIESGNTLVKNLQILKNKTDQLLSKTTDDIDDTLNDYLTYYINQLTGFRNDNRKCERFITICEQLLYYIQQVEFEKYFPLLNKKMIEWESLLGTNDRFQPKIIDIFKEIEKDLNQNIIPSIACRIGFIGEISVGKTSLINCLRTINYNDNDNLQNVMNEDTILFSPVRVGKSTYCKLEFEHQYDNENKVIFVDIEGSTDIDSDLKAGNYFDEIKKANCDLYIIVYDHQLTDIQRMWYDYIINELNRTCWFVRNKVDELFLNTFKEDVGQDYYTSNEVIKNRYTEKVIERIRQLSNFDISGKKIDNIYLTFTFYNKNTQNENLFKILFSKFDIEKLSNDIKNLPLHLHQNRLQNMALCAMARVINICFRRGYVVNVMKYKIAAGITAAIPFLDLIPRYYGREEIRQAFGVNTRSRFMNWLLGRTDEFKDYLQEFHIDMDVFGFKTSVINKTCRNNATNTHGNTHMSSAVVKGVTGVGVAGVSASSEVVKTVGIGTVNAVRSLSATLIVAGAVLTVGMCAWSAVSNGQQIYNYLNRLCDDLILVSGYVTMKIIQDNNEIRDLFLQKE